jgi:EmrB/QacA subfamily drug resistance transporter
VQGRCKDFHVSEVSDPKMYSIVAMKRRWGGLCILLAAIFVATLDNFIVFVATPSIRSGLGATFADTELIIAGYTLMAAIGLIASGRLGDRFGRRRMFMVGFAAFTIASGLCGIAQSPSALIVFRLLQGFAASLLSPQVFAVIRITVPDDRERAKAFGWMGVTIGVGAIAGQVAGGLIVAADIWHLGWRPIFLINVPVGICAIVAAPFFIGESIAVQEDPIDLVGAMLSGLGFGMLLYPLMEGREAGWPLWSTVMLGGGVVVLGAFGLHQRWKTRIAAFPLLNTDLFHDRAFSVGICLTLLFYGTLPPLMLSFSYLAQMGFARSPMAAALGLAPQAVSFTITSLITGRRTHDRARQLLAGGSIVVAIGALAAYLVYALFAVPRPEDLVLPLIVLGIGQGMFMTPVLNVALSAIPPVHSGAAAGVLITAQRAGSAAGLAVFELPFFTTLNSAHSAGASPSAAYFAAFAAVVLSIFLTMLCVLALVALLPAPSLSDRQQEAAVS